MFILAKSRLAPLKERLLTIPKLELQAALIAARMRETVLREISFQPRATFLWTDSITVIRYIQNEKGHFQLFVMHRINEIRQLSEIQSGITSLVNKIQQTCAQGPRQILN